MGLSQRDIRGKQLDVLRTVFWTLVSVAGVLLLLTMLWMNVGSGLLFKPLDWKYDGETGKVTVRKVVNWPDPLRIRWTTEVWAENSLECSYTGTMIVRSTRPISTYDLPDDLRPCIDDKETVTVIAYTVLLFGTIPLRPVYLSVPPDAQQRLFE